MSGNTNGGRSGGGKIGVGSVVIVSSSVGGLGSDLGDCGGVCHLSSVGSLDVPGAGDSDCGGGGGDVLYGVYVGATHLYGEFC